MLSTDEYDLRGRVAAVAARFIAEDGLDYAGAKARAVREVIGDQGRHHDCMPDNATVIAAVREHQALFMSDTQPARLARLREVACDAMRFLTDADLELEPFAQGALVNGTAGEHSDVHLVSFSDRAKDVEICLLNAGIDYDVTEAPDGRGGETLSFLWPPRRPVPPGQARDTRPPEAVHLTITDPRGRRGGAPGERADLAQLERLAREAGSGIPDSLP
jgi:hypothetical protein